MKNKIKRPSVGWVSNDQDTRASLEQTIFPVWYDEVQESNRFIYRFSSAIKSWISELSRDQNFVLSEFALDLVDTTKPYYVSRVKSTNSIPTDSRRKLSENEEDLYSDVYRHAIQVPCSWEEYEEKYKVLEANLGNYKIITKEDIDAARLRTDIGRKVRELLLSQEILLGGELLCVTSFGRIIDIENARVVSGLEREQFTQVRDSGYFCLPLLSEPLTYKFLDVDDEAMEEDPGTYILGFSNDVTNYIPDYDIDQDGYISPEDIQFIRSSIGRSLDNTSEEDWRTTYFKLDKNQDGVISESDVAHAELSLHAVMESCILVRKPVSGFCKMSYGAYPEPYITYASPESTIRGGTFNYIIPNPLVDYRVADGYIENESGYILGFNRNKGEIWTGRIIENTYHLQKVSYVNQSKMTVIGMTSVDNVAFFLLEATVPDFRFYNSRYAILRVDFRKEKVEYSSDIISLNVKLEEEQRLTGIQSTESKDSFYLFTSDNQILRIKMIRNAVLAQSGILWLSEGSDALIPAGEIEERRRIYNGVDSFAFNFGMERLHMENNRELIRRIEIKAAEPPNNSISGIHNNYCLDIGIYKPWYKVFLYRDVYVELSNPIDLSEQVVLNVVTEEEGRYPNPIATIHIADAIEHRKVEQKKAFVDGTIKAIRDEVHEEVYFELNGGDLTIDKTLILRKRTIERIATALVKSSVETVVLAPDMDEELTQFEKIRLQVEYTTIDPNGEKRRAENSFLINIPCIDLIRNSEVREDGEICQIPPKCKVASIVPRTYAMTKAITKTYVGPEAWERRIEKIRNSDTSFWKTTIFDVTPFDDRLNSTYIIDKSLFNSGDFISEQEEVVY